MKSKGKFAKRILLFSFIFVVLYTIVVTVLTYSTGIPEPSTLTTCVFTYFSIESILLMVKKLKGGNENESNNDYDDINDCECGGTNDKPYCGGNQGYAVVETDTDEHRGSGYRPATREPWYIRIFRL